MEIHAFATDSVRNANTEDTVTATTIAVDK